VGAIVQARIGRLVFGCLDPKGGAVESLYQLCDDSRLNHRLPVAGGMLAADCSAILEGFFNRLRQKQRDETKAERWPSPAEGAWLEIKFTHRVTGVQIPPSPPNLKALIRREFLPFVGSQSKACAEKSSCPCPFVHELWMKKRYTLNAFLF
jgi:MafB19-like deaminase